MALSRWLLRGRAARRPAPHLVGEPFEPLLRVVDLRGGHPLGTPGDLPRVGEQIVQHLAQRPVAAPLRLGPRTHAVWIPSARSSALRNSSAAARSVEAMPRSAPGATACDAAPAAPSFTSSSRRVARLPVSQ